jgi:hypothetical protein
MWFHFLPLHHTISKILFKIIEKVFLTLFGPSFSLAINITCVVPFLFTHELHTQLSDSTKGLGATRTPPQNSDRPHQGSKPNRLGSESLSGAIPNRSPNWQVNNSFQKAQRDVRVLLHMTLWVGSRIGGYHRGPIPRVPDAPNPDAKLSSARQPIAPAPHRHTNWTS